MVEGELVAVVVVVVVVAVVVVEVVEEVEEVEVCDDVVEVEVDVSWIVEREVGSFVVAVVVLVVVVIGGGDVVDGVSQSLHLSVTSPSCT